MGEPIISFKNVQKAFEDNVIYTGLSLDVFQGETLTVIGGSGVGKSVMLKLLIGLLKPDSGSIVAFGDDVTQMKDRDLQKLRQKVGMLFQGGALFDSMTVEENISYSLVEHKWGSVSEMKDRVATVLEMVGLSGIVYRRWSSSGES